jgi:tetratricopeptide (TPR) repeat protein
MRTLALLAIAGIGVAVAPRAADAEAAVDPPARARLLSDEGRAAHDAGDYAKAIAAYKEAYELAPSPGLLFNMGQAYRLNGQCAEAAIMYRSYLRSDPDRSHRQLTKAHLAVVEGCMARRSALSPLIGTHGGSHRKDQGESRPTPPGQSMKRGGIALAIGGGVMVGLGVYFAIEAADASSDVEDAYERGARWKEIEEIDARGRRASTLATVFTLGGGAAAVSGGVLYFMGRRAERAGRPGITIAPRRGGGEVRFAWEW